MEEKNILQFLQLIDARRSLPFLYPCLLPTDGISFSFPLVLRVHCRRWGSFP